MSEILLISATLLSAAIPGVNLRLVQDAVEQERLDRPALEDLLRASPLAVAGCAEHQKRVSDYNVRLLRFQRRYRMKPCISRDEIEEAAREAIVSRRRLAD